MAIGKTNAGGGVSAKKYLKKDYEIITGRKGVVFKINALPSNAVVRINGKVQSEVKVAVGSLVWWDVKLKEYESQSGKLIVQDGQETLNIVLEERKFAYGVGFSGTNPVGKRLGDAIGATVAINGASSFDKFEIYKDIKRVDLSGRTMVQIPKTYFKRVNAGTDNEEWWVSNKKYDASFQLHPAFQIYNGTVNTGRERDFVYVGAYKTSGNPANQCKTGTTPSTKTELTTSGTIGKFQEWAQNIGDGWCQTNWMTYGLCQMLFTIEHANRNSQGVMVGNQSGSRQSNGLTDSTYKLNEISNVQVSTTAMCWRGIENLYSNVREWYDGVYNVGGYYICYDPTKFNSKANHAGAIDNYIKLNYNPGANVGGNIHNLGYDSNHIGAMFPQTFAGTYNQDYFCDYGDVYGSSSYPFANVGADWTTNTAYGLFLAYFGYSATSASTGIGSRLAYLPM